MPADDFFLTTEDQELIRKALVFYSEHPEYHPGTHDDALAACEAAGTLAKEFE